MSTDEANRNDSQAMAESPGWDFHLNRSGLVIKAGRHLRLSISLALLLWIMGVAAGSSPLWTPFLL